MDQDKLKFLTLSVKDLLDAREAFHIHLMKKQNVVGTAIGKYRMRKNAKETREPKRLDNTKVVENSYPCILVFVKDWLTEHDFKTRAKMADYIPPRVSLPDDREIPICVIEAPLEVMERDMVNEEEIIFPSDYVGGGYPLLIDAQGVEKMASIGCIVSDGNKYYALTNRHVTGDPGTIVYTKVKGTAVPIGTSAAKSIGNVPFNDLYPGWQASNLVVSVDAGLIEIDNIRYWKTDIFGIGDIGKVFDLHTANLSLELIGSTVKAFGGASGKLDGEITALFFRYKSVGGREYVSDFLIGPARNKPSLPTKNGDSGTIWVRETEDEGVKINQPIAIQWGQHCFPEAGKTLQHNYALATCLSSVLRELDMDIVSGWNEDAGYTWGEVGHYTIANFAAGMVTNKQLATLMKNNLELITFQQQDLITDATINKKRKTINYTALADVPDLVWKIRKNTPYKRTLEGSNHFADMDKVDSEGKTLLDRCVGKGDHMKFLTPEDWLSYYTDESVRDGSKGILPFRVWQIYLEMVSAAEKGNVVRFLTAAGILAHYVGDACQPLHISYMFNGIPASGKGDAKKGDGVHEFFEAKMINKYNKEIIPKVQALVKTKPYKTLLEITTGKQAAAATVDLMKKTFKTIAPKTIVDAFVKDGDNFVDSFWKAKGSTVVPGLFASGGYTLASLWNSAWIKGGGSKNIKNLAAVDPDDVKNLYQDQSFIPSVNIKGIGEYCK